MLKGSKHSELSKAKMRETALSSGVIPPSRRGVSHSTSLETREKIRNSLLGRKHTTERRLNQSRAKLGKKMSKEFCQKLSERNKGLGIKPPTMYDERHPNWKGDNVGYVALHMWVARNLGKPDMCEHCGKSGLQGKRINWANKSREYKRDLNDWLRLCIHCHRQYDKKDKKNLAYVS